MRQNLFFFSILLCSNSPAFADSKEFESFPMIRHIASDVDKQKLVAIEMDRHSFSLGHMAIFNQNKERVPFIIRKVAGNRSHQVTKLIPARITGDTSKALTGKNLVLNYKLTESQSINQVTIETKSKDFEKQVSIEGSENGKIWQALIIDYPIFDLNDVINLRRTSIPLPTNSFQYFKVTIEQIKQTKATVVETIVTRDRTKKNEKIQVEKQIGKHPFQIERITFKSVATINRRDGYQRKTYQSINKLNSATDEKTKQSIYTFDGSMIPLQALKFTTDSTNFRRHVSVYGKTPFSDDWVWLNQSYLSNYQLDDFLEEKLTINFPSKESRFSDYQIRIDNENATPLKLNSAELIGCKQEAIWVAEPGENYLAGFREKVTATPDDKAISTLLNKSFSPIAVKWLDLPKANDQFNQSETRTNHLLAFQDWFIWIGISTVILALSIAILWTIRRVDDLDEEQWS